ncbi:MAG: hypothetical protein AAFQ89_19170 [Cyanobacteria bacterium J06626_18]
MLPIVIPEKLAVIFKYWQSEIKVGMRYQYELYTHLRNYTLDQRLEAYDDAYQLSEMSLKACITVTNKGYTLWQSLRTIASKEADFPNNYQISQQAMSPYQTSDNAFMSDNVLTSIAKS